MWDMGSVSPELRSVRRALQTPVSIIRIQKTTEGRHPANVCLLQAVGSVAAPDEPFGPTGWLPSMDHALGTMA